MRFFYSLAIHLYGIGVKVASLWNPQARLLREGWKHSFARLAPLQGRRTVWFHVASLGEFEQARPVMENFRRQYPHLAVCLTFFSPSGYEVRRDYPGADVVAYLPLDTPAQARRWVQALNPVMVFWTKYDYWFNYLICLRERKIPTYLFSAIFRRGQYFFYKIGGGWFRKCLSTCFTHLYVQNQESVALLHQYHIHHVSCVGDTRFDRVYDILRSNTVSLNVDINAFSQGRPVIVAGSTWEPDERNLCYFLQHYQGDIKLILAPHVVSESHLQYIEQLFAGRTLRYTQATAQETSDATVLIIDTIGILSHLYRYATVAYVGGGFGKGIHNILEAIVYGKPVAFGPNHTKFNEAVNICARGGGRAYSTPEELLQILQQWLTHQDAYQQAARQCEQYTRENIGATQQILNTIDTQRLQPATHPATA